MRVRKRFKNHSPQTFLKMKNLTNFNESEMKAFAEEALNNDELFVITGGGPGEEDDILLPDPPPRPQ